MENDNKKGHGDVLEMVSILKFTDIYILNTLSKKHALYYKINCSQILLHIV